MKYLLRHVPRTGQRLIPNPRPLNSNLHILFANELFFILEGF